MRGSLRFLAQRPLPSMMMATCRGVGRESGMTSVELVNTCRQGAFGCGPSDSVDRGAEPLAGAPRQERAPSRRARELDRHQVRLLRMEQLVDVGDVPIGHLLNLVLRLPL